MIHKILFFTLLVFAAFPARAETNQFCFSSAKLTEMRNQMNASDSETQRAYNELFQTMVAKNENGATNNAGCVTVQELAQLCKNVWDTLTAPCETFIYAITTAAAKANATTLQFSNLLTRTNFNDINPDAFQQAINKTLARRRDKHLPSKLQNMGSVFLEQAKEKQIDPFLAAGISMYESTYGTSAAARNKNNIAGLDGKGGHLSFPSVQASITKQAETIQKWITPKTTLSELAHSGHYCAKSVATKWTTDVSSITKVIYRNYNAILQGQK